MARRTDGGRARGPLWLGVAAAAALAAGVAYYLASIGSQPSLVSGEGAERVAPAEVEAEALDEPVGATGGGVGDDAPGEGAAGEGAASE